MASDIILRAKAELLRRQRLASGQSKIMSFDHYQMDPVGFGKEVLGETYTDDVIAVMESVRDNPVTIAKSANAVGKSHGAARIAVWFYKVFQGAQVYTTAAPPENNLKRVLWGEIGTIVNKKPQIFRDDRVGTLNIMRGPQEFITGVAIPMAGTPEQREAKFSGKHAPFLLFIVDEGDAVPNEVYKGIESCMSGGFARLLVMFNPRSQAGPVYNMERNHQAKIVGLSAMSHPNVLTGNDVIPGAVSREKTVRRINEWSRPLLPGEKKDLECFELPAILEGATATGLDGTEFLPLPPGIRKVTNPSLSYMVFGEYPAQNEMQLISRAWVENAVSRYYVYVASRGNQPPTDYCIMGQDVAEFGKDWNYSCFRYGGYVPPLIGWNGVDPDTTAIKAANLFNEKLGTRCFVDATGVGSGVAPRMSRLGVEAHSVKVAERATYSVEEGSFKALRDQLWWRVREWLRTDPGAMLPPDDDLLQELTTPAYTVQGGTIRVTDKKTMRELMGRSPDKADALCLTFADDLVTAEISDSPLVGYRG